MSQQKDNLYFVILAYEDAKKDPAVSPEELEILRRAKEILERHWPYSRDLETAQAADKQTGKLNVSVPHEFF